MTVHPPARTFSSTVAAASEGNNQHSAGTAACDMENLRPHSALQAPTGLTDLFKAGVGFGHARDSPATLAEAPCAKELNFSQNTAGGMFAESQELGCGFMPGAHRHTCAALQPSALLASGCSLSAHAKPALVVAQDARLRDAQSPPV